MKTVTQAAVDELKELMRRRDRHAFGVGIAFVEYELNKARTISEAAPDMLTKLGALVVEFEGYRTNWMTKVNDDLKKSKEVETLALLAAGIDVNDGKRYTIDLDNCAIMVLVNGEWIKAE